ncbi:hypothetical protein Tco_0731287 [Tanacetum coccineum]
MLLSLSDQIKETIALVFQNYKSLDESSPSGVTSIKSGSISPAIDPALKLYSLLHDIESPEAKMHLYKYFQTTVQKIMGRYLTETDDYVSGSGRNSTVDQSSYTIGYCKMKSLVINIRNEIVSDIEMHDKQVLPTFYETPTGYGIAQMATNGNHGKVVYHMREILRLEPRFDDEVLPADENSKVEEAEEKKE